MSSEDRWGQFLAGMVICIGIIGAIYVATLLGKPYCDSGFEELEVVHVQPSCIKCDPMGYCANGNFISCDLGQLKAEGDKFIRYKHRCTHNLEFSKASDIAINVINKALSTGMCYAARLDLNWAVSRPVLELALRQDQQLAEKVSALSTQGIPGSSMDDLVEYTFASINQYPEYYNLRTFPGGYYALANFPVQAPLSCTFRYLQQFVLTYYFSVIFTVTVLLGLTWFWLKAQRRQAMINLLVSRVLQILEDGQEDAVPIDEILGLMVTSPDLEEERVWAYWPDVKDIVGKHPKVVEQMEGTAENLVWSFREE